MRVCTTIDFSNADYNINNKIVQISSPLFNWIYLILYSYFDGIVQQHDVGVPRKPWFPFDVCIGVRG